MMATRIRPGIERWWRIGTVVGLSATMVTSGCLEVAVMGSVTQSSGATTAGEDAAVIAALVLLGVLIGAGISISVEEDVSSYLDEHRRDIERANARGDGAFVRDLAAALGVPSSQVAHLGDVLRRSRTSLANALTERPAEREFRARAFGQALVATLHRDGVLAALVEPDHVMERARTLGMR